MELDNRIIPPNNPRRSENKEIILAVDSRDTHELYMKFQCIFNSLTRQANSHLNLTSDEFEITVTNGTSETIITNGPLYLKTILREAHMDSMTTMIVLCTKIITLPTTIQTFWHTIPIFNVHVRKIVADLAARGELVWYLVDYLFRAYITAPDSSFTRYVKCRQDFYEEINELKADKILESTKNKYISLVTMYRWKSLAPEKSKIIVLETKIRSLEKKRQTKKGPPFLLPRRKVKMMIKAVINRDGSRDEERPKSIFPRGGCTGVRPKT